MNSNERASIEAVLDDATARVKDGEDEFQAARAALAGCSASVRLDLAVAAVVDSVRARQREATLTVERAAARPKPRVSQVERDERQMKRFSDMASVMTPIIERYADEMRMEWTAELLASAFTLDDGTRVNWGDATVDQHSQRVEMFRRNAMANAEGAARHLKAVGALRLSGCSTLRELVGEARLAG